MIILMGVAGAGKSMQGRMLADEEGYTWVSTGEMFRSQMTPERMAQLAKGDLVSDEEVIELVDKTFASMDLTQEFILDGFPRTQLQADWLLKQITSGRVQLTALVNLVITREVVKARLLQRGRDDDTEEVIEHRFKDYEKLTLPLVDFFKGVSQPVVDVNGDQTPEEVHHDILEFINRA